jgi:hypothetical protein
MATKDGKLAKASLLERRGCGSISWVFRFLHMLASGNPVTGIASHEDR